MLSLAAPVDSNKKPKLAAVQQQGTDGGGNKGKDTGGKGGEGKGKRKGNDQALESGTDAAKTEAKASGKSEGKPCSFYLTPKGCSKGRQCGFVHQYGKAKGESRCYNCGSTEHRQNDCTRPTGGGKPHGSVQGKGKGSKGSSSSTPAGSLGVGGDAADSSNLTNPVPLAAKVSADGGVATLGGVPGNKGVSQSSQNQTQNVANAHAQVLEEAQKLLKSLRIASMRVGEGRKQSPERIGATQGESDGPENPEEERRRVNATEVIPDPEIFVPAVAIRRSRMPTGLLDGGATHALRTAKEGEWEQATPTRVALAVGSQELRISPVGTVLSQDPIAPLGLLVDLLGCRVTWNAGQCTVEHPTRGELQVWLEDNCPVFSEGDCLDLIREIEQFRASRLRQALHIRAVSLGLESPTPLGPQNLGGSDQELITWLKDRFPEAPDWLLLRSLPVRDGYEGQSPYHIPGLNRRARKALKKAKHIVLHVFSGRTKPVEFALGSDIAVVNLDVLYGSNVLDERVYAAAAALCSTGKVDAVLGGPPCCTNSVLRGRGSDQNQGGSDGGPRPVRSRTGLLRFGLPTNTVSEQPKVEEHTILITRFLTLHHIADVFNPRRTMCALENPQDPMTYLPESRRHSEIPSLWAWPEILALLEGSNSKAGAGTSMLDHPDHEEGAAAPSDHSWFLAQFDQGALGHTVRKPHAVLTNSWELFETLHELRGPGTGCNLQDMSTILSERIQASGSWAKWAAGLCQAVGKAVRGWIATTEEDRRESEEEGRVALKALTQKEREFRAQAGTWSFERIAVRACRDRCGRTSIGVRSIMGLTPFV